MSRLDAARWGIVMDPDRAAFVRYLRVELGCSWTTVARECAVKWSGNWGDSQLVGIAICRTAAKHLGEAGSAAPWN